MSKKTAATAKVNPGGVMKTATTTKTTTKPKMSAKQYAQYLRYVRRHPAKTAKARKARKLAGPCSGGWVAGGNDLFETCAMTAVANSLLLSSGLRASDEEITAFGEGLTIAEALARKPPSLGSPATSRHTSARGAISADRLNNASVIGLKCRRRQGCSTVTSRTAGCSAAAAQHT